MKYSIYTIGVILIMNIVPFCGKGQTPIWSVPPGAVNDFPILQPLPTYTGGPAVQHYTGQSAAFSSNAMVDVQQGLQFFIVDGYLYDKEGFHIAEFKDPITGGTLLASHEIAIIPDPSFCERYYIFFISQSNAGASQKAYYAILDMTIPNDLETNAPDNCAQDYGQRMGNLISLNASGNTCLELSSIGPSLTYGSGHGNFSLAASQLIGSRVYSLLISNGVWLFKYSINNNGIQYESAENLFEGVVNDNQRSEMELLKLKTGGYIAAIPYYSEVGFGVGDASNRIALIKYDDNMNYHHYAGTIELPVCNLELTSIHGIELVEADTLNPLVRVYFTHDPCTPATETISYAEFDPSIGYAPDFKTINPLVLIPNHSDFQYSFIESNGNELVFAYQNGFASMSNPANPNLPTDWNTNYLSFSYPLSWAWFGITDNKQAFLLPDQIDQWDYMEQYKNITACCVQSGYYTYNTERYCASASSIWQPGATNNPFSSVTGEVTVRDELRIPAGVNITLKNMTIKFAPGARLVLENGVAFNTGAKLTLDNTTLTVDDRCAPGSLMWEGVKVLGSPFQAQGTATTGPQAWLMLTNNSVIEHALTGASAVPSVTGYTGNKAGGVIQAKNSTFYNNVTDVEITNYGSLSSTQKSRFVRTAFVTGATLNNGDASIKNHVVLNSVQGIRFAGCTFENQLTGYDILLSGTGIFATNSRFYAEPACNIGCTTTYPTVFKNLKSGIRAYTSNGLHTATIRGCVFESNISGALLSGLQFATVIKNDFKVFVPNIPLGQGYGLYLNGCTGYQVEDNDFEEYIYSTLPAGNNTYGIIVNNSGTDDNFIYRNRMNHLKIGGQSQGTNARPYSFSLPSAGITGLQWRCNEFSGDMYQADLAVTSGYIDYEQGDLLLPISSLAESALAGNTFSHSLNDPQNDIAVNSNVEPFHYYHHSNVSQTPLYFSTTSVFPATNGLGYLSTSCRSRLRSFVVTTEIPQIENEIASIDFLTDSLRQKVDCGNTRDLMIFITGTHSAGSKKNRLLQCSPYLSDEVLTAYIFSNPPAGHLSQVILANSPLSNTVADVLNAQILPAGIAGNIQNAQTGISPMMYLNNEIGYLQKERWLLVDDMIRVYLNDSTFADPLREIELILNRERWLRRQEQLCDTRICLGDSTQAVLVKDSLQNTEGYYNYIRLAEVHLAAVNGCVCEAVRTDSALRSKVEYVATDVNDPVMAVRGEALLTAAFDTVFTEIIEELNPVGAGRNYIPLPETVQPAISGISVYPNPAQNQINLSISELSASETDSQNHYTFTDAAGRTVLSGTFTGNKATLNVTQLSAGVYTVTIRGNSAVHSAVAVIR